MNPFEYARAGSVDEALQLARKPGARFLGGGTNLVDLMRETVEQPAVLIDVTGLPGGIDVRDDGGLLIGAAVRNTAVAEHAVVRQRYPVLARAVLAGASGQIRNMATVGGNLLQRTRCSYFYDTAGSRCNKRQPGTGCDAVDGLNRGHAILGASDSCVATHPSDMAVALTALDAVVHVIGEDGARTIPVEQFHRLPGDQPQLDTQLRPGELITVIEIPALPEQTNSAYRKVRDRASYAFALVSVAAAVRTQDDVIQDVRIALGGVAHKPWRARTAERELAGKMPTTAAFQSAAESELAAAEPLRDNGFKVELARRTMTAVLQQLTEVTA